MRKKMSLQIVTINLPNEYVSAIQTLIDLGTQESRSQTIRVALSEFLDKELAFAKNLKKNKMNSVN